MAFHAELIVSNVVKGVSTLMSANSNILLLDVLDSVSIIQTKLLVDPLHAGSVLGSKCRTVATKVDIQLFESLVFGLRNKEPYKESPTASKASEEDVRAKFHAVEHIPCRQADDEVELCKVSMRRQKEEI